MVGITTIKGTNECILTWSCCWLCRDEKGRRKKDRSKGEVEPKWKETRGRRDRNISGIKMSVDWRCCCNDMQYNYIKGNKSGWVYIYIYVYVLTWRWLCRNKTGRRIAAKGRGRAGMKRDTGRKRQKQKEVTSDTKFDSVHCERQPLSGGRAGSTSTQNSLANAMSAHRSV